MPEDDSFDVVLLTQILHNLGGNDMHSSDILRQQCEQTLLEHEPLLQPGLWHSATSTSKIGLGALGCGLVPDGGFVVCICDAATGVRDNW